MHSEFSFSSPQAGKRHEQSILNEYRRLNMDQQSFYFSIEPISYSPVPKFLPSVIARDFSHCIYLQNSTFYQMFTFAIFQFLFRSPPSVGAPRLAKLKDLVCSNSFLNFASFTKGLILKGLKSMGEQAGSSPCPVAEVLLGSEKLPAFCQCWKEMLFYFKNKHQEPTDLNSSMIEVFTQFFEVDLIFYTKKGKQFKEELIRGKRQGHSAEIISVLLISSSYEEDENSIKEQSISSISSIYGNWSYYILLTNADHNREEAPAVDLPLTKRAQSIARFKAGRRATIALDYPQLFSIDQEMSPTKSKVGKEPKQILISNAMEAVQKGKSLLERMKKFTESIITN